MSQFYAPTPEQRLALEQLAEQVADVQRTLVANHPRLKSPDRAAHQQQLAGGKVFLTVDAQLPKELDGLGLFQRGSGPHVGIGRMSTGLGCPHAETDPDFLGLLAAFRTGDGRRVDFVALNHGGAPTDTPEEFIALLKATADAAGAEHSSDLLNLGLDTGEAARRSGEACRHACASDRRPRDPPDVADDAIEQRLSAALDRRRPRTRRARQVHVRAHARRKRATSRIGRQALSFRRLARPSGRECPRVPAVLDPVPQRARDAARRTSRRNGRNSTRFRSER